MAPSCSEGNRTWVIRQAIRAAAVGENRVQRPQPTRNRGDLHILPQPLADLGPCVGMNFLAEAANRQYLIHLCLHPAVHWLNLPIST
ncbi:MAG: hypothetical protein A2V62_12460 [Nitrospirae bacterium RBG_19FT_COMBO_58_9]|nr:MAG: hypothetical protein A2V62_12460 [Nitrospirae bacterium RBG_19FT_COMBO_58_9]